MKKTMRFFASSLVFFNMATLTKHCILQYESYFFIFRVFVIFTKKHGKNNAKMLEAGFVAKITTEWSPGRYFGSKNAPEFTSETTKIAKIDQKSSFLARQFFTRFFHRKKCNFSPIKVQPGSVLVRRAFGPVPHGRLLLIGYILRIYSKNTF